MAGIAEQQLTLEEFRDRYADRKPYFEYWDGQAIQKSVPTKLHAKLQQIILACCASWATKRFRN
jgi:Uma2 family endonuclease